MCNFTTTLLPQSPDTVNGIGSPVSVFYINSHCGDAALSNGYIVRLWIVMTLQSSAGAAGASRGARGNPSSEV